MTDKRTMLAQTPHPATLLLLGLLLGVFAAPRQAQAGGKPDLQVQVSLVSSRTFSLGEPIVLKYKIFNTSLERAETYMGEDQAGWVTETLADSQGHTLPIQTRQPLHRRGGAHLNGMSVSPTSTAAGYVVFNLWTTIHTAGTYKVTVHTRLPYALGMQAETVPPSRYESTGNVSVNDFTFSLNVMPHAAQALKQAAETLRQNAAAARLQEWSSAAAEALFSMPEADVSPVWQEMISDPTTPRYALGFAAEQLVRLHTLAAADLVAQMRWEPARPLQTGETPLGAMELDEMSQIGDDQLRKHIVSLYAAHGEAHAYSLVVAD